MFRRYATLVGLLVCCAFTARAQSGTAFGFEYRPVAKVVQGADTLTNAWAGGLNTPQFSSIDLNGDGVNDLFAFDRETSRCYTFLNAANPAGGRRWQYAPDYEALFPTDLIDWVLLRDYDCDGRPDIFTSLNNSGVRVFRNAAGTGGRPNFTQSSAQLRFQVTPTSSANIVVGAYNMPDFRDVNGDGKLDLVTYDYGNYYYINYFVNTSPGTCGGALMFSRETTFWGNLTSCSGCAGYVFSGQSAAQCTTVTRPLHSQGHNMMLIDLDGDGDQDLLDGRDNCPELVRLLNQGTATTANFPPGSGSSSFPTAAAPTRAATYPAGYLIDADFDGRNDVLVAPNMYDNRADLVGLRHPVNFYRDAAASGAPSLAAAPQGFLRDIIDVSEVAAPAFGDIDGDGLKDMLVGNFADQVGTDYRGSIAYYRNVGTSRRPVFRLVTDDYLGLSARHFFAFKPVLVDLNRDGAIDLAYSATDLVLNGVCFISYILNTAAPGQALVLNTANTNYFKPRGQTGTGILPYWEGAMPCFTDVDNDGYVDLLIGTNETREPGMGLRYFRNRGTGPLDSAFVLVNNDFGQIRTGQAPPYDRPDNLSPVVTDFDGDGRLDLITVDFTGTVRFFSDYRTQTGAFLERTDLLYNNLLGQYRSFTIGAGPKVRYGLATADIDNDGAPELYVGQEGGGILAYATRNRLATATRAEAARTLALNVYPNPAQTTASVATAMPTRLTLLDLTGRVVRPTTAAARQHTLNLTGLAAGVYLVRAEATDGTVAVQRLAVQ